MVELSWIAMPAKLALAMAALSNQSKVQTMWWAHPLFFDGRGHRKTPSTPANGGGGVLQV